MGAPAETTFEPKNHLLAVLPPEDAARLRPHLERVALPQGRVLFDAGEPYTRVYFPEEGVVSIVCLFEDGATAEMATVGKEGVVGAGVLLGGDIAISRHMVQVPGSALAIDGAVFRDGLQESRTLRSLAGAYTQAFIAQVLQSVACNGVHAVDERCARWLLMTHDRSEGDTFALTQEYLAQMLGVHRPTVSIAARALQRAGLIRYSRGAITVLDRPGLEEASCECYRIIRRHYERLLPPRSG